MDKADVEECIDMLKNKKCEGFDRIPVCVIKDAKNPLLDPMCKLLKNTNYQSNGKCQKLSPSLKKVTKLKLKITDQLET